VTVPAFRHIVMAMPLADRAELVAGDLLVVSPRSSLV
jgi:hypothetical protein